MRKSLPMAETLDEHEARIRRRGRWGQGVFIVLGLLMVLAYFLMGCATSLMSQEPKHQTVLVKDSPEVAFARAYATLGRMGAEITIVNSYERIVSGRVHGAVVLLVLVQPVEGGSRIEVTGSLVPGMMVVGSFDEVQTYVALLQ